MRFGTGCRYSCAGPKPEVEVIDKDIQVGVIKIFILLVGKKALGFNKNQRTTSKFMMTNYKTIVDIGKSFFKHRGVEIGTAS